MKTVVVIGAGPAGCAAAVQCRRLGFDVRLFDRQGQAGGLVANGFLIENYPGIEPPVTGPAFAARLQALLQRFSVSVLASSVHRIEGTSHSFTVHADGETLTADAVVVATGTAPVVPDIPGVQNSDGHDGLFFEVRELERRCPAASDVVIIGGGEASFDYALTLTRMGVSVKLLCRRTQPRVHGRLAEQVAAEPLIHLQTDVQVIRLERDGARPEVHALAGNGESLRLTCDAVLAAVGRRRSLPILPGNMLPSTDALTPLPGLYICGDARLGTLGQAVMAAGDGMAAAVDIARAGSLH